MYEILKKEYDLALTSPPYYNLEVYTEEENQSHNYGSYEDWVENFLKPVVYGVLDKLIDTGYIMLVIVLDQVPTNKETK